MSQHNSWASWHTPANAGDTGEMWVQSLGQEDPVKGEIAACPSIIAWKIPWTVEPGELQSMGLQRVGCDWAQHNSRTDFGRLWSKNQFYKNCLFCGMIKVILLSLVTLSIFKKKTKSVKGNNSSHYPYCVCVCHCSHFMTPWTVALQAPLFMVFSGQEYWSGLPFLYPGDLPNPGIKPSSLALQADCLPSEPTFHYYITIT